MYAINLPNGALTCTLTEKIIYKRVYGLSLMIKCLSVENMILPREFVRKARFPANFSHYRPVSQEELIFITVRLRFHIL
jgi:hypothetical protein